MSAYRESCDTVDPAIDDLATEPEHRAADIARDIEIEAALRLEQIYGGVNEGVLLVPVFTPWVMREDRGDAGERLA